MFGFPSLVMNTRLAMAVSRLPRSQNCARIQLLATQLYTSALAGGGDCPG